MLVAQKQQQAAAGSSSKQSPDTRTTTAAAVVADRLLEKTTTWHQDLDMCSRKLATGQGGLLWSGMVRSISTVKILVCFLRGFVSPMKDFNVLRSLFHQQYGH
jgi:hypothetical protein